MPLSQSHYSFVVTGLTRNCEKSVAKSIEVIGRAFASAKSVSWLVIESDSSDNTVAELERLSKSVPNFGFRSLGHLKEKHPKRTDRIAQCRNQAIEVLRTDPAYADVDFVVVADLDGLNTRLTVEAIDSCFVRDDWDACLANQEGPYYDMWALRHPIWAPFDYWALYYFFLGLGLSKYQAMQRSIYAHAITIPKTSPWIEVDSGFGGLALYKRQAYLRCHYEGLDQRGEEICEHVPFSAQFKTNGGRILINPRLINSGRSEHTSRFSRLLFLTKLKIKEMLGKQ